MDKPRLHFAHANGFPLATYKRMLSILSTRFDVHGIECLGHDSQYPVDARWRSLVKHVIAEIEEQGAPVVGVGHSLGGVLIYFAAIERPDLFTEVIILDAPMFNPIKAGFLELLKWLGLHKHFVPGKNALRRRSSWPTHEDAYKHFSVRRPFKYFDEQVLHDYVSSFETKESGVELKFKPAVEARVFDDMPTNIYKRKLKVPGHFIFGKRSDVVSKADLASIMRKTPLRLVAMDGSHLFAMEKPLQTAELVMSLANRGG